MSDAIEVKGLKETQKALYAYSQKLGDFVVYKALREGATITRKRVSSLAPVYSGKSRPDIKKGTLKRGFKVSKSRIHNGKRSSDLIGVFLTLKKGKGRKDLNDPFYGRWQELGWNTAGARKGVSRADNGGRATAPGKTNVPGVKFMERAFNQTKANAVDVIVRSAQAGADVLAKREGLK